MAATAELMQHQNEWSTPQHPLNLFFYSTPSSPRFDSSPYHHHHHHHSDHHSDHISLLSHHHHHHSEEPSSSVPFNWELIPGIPRSPSHAAPSDHGDFDFSGQLDRMVTPSLSSADELFHGGIIRPLKPPPRLLHTPSPPAADSPKSPKKMSIFKDALSLSPKQRPKLIDDDPFEAALNNQVRGRGRHQNASANNRKGISRSLSPLRVSEFALLRQQQEADKEEQSSGLRSSSGDSKKWRLKDLFLFRSASEGRPKKYSFLSRRSSVDSNNDKDGSSHDSRNSSFRSTTSGGGSVSKRRAGQVKISAHEMHYTAKKAVSEDMKKKTRLPYRHGLLGCIGLNPILENLSNAFAS